MHIVHSLWGFFEGVSQVESSKGSYKSSQSITKTNHSHLDLCIVSLTTIRRILGVFFKGGFTDWEPWAIK